MKCDAAAVGENEACLTRLTIEAMRSYVIAGEGMMSEKLKVSFGNGDVAYVSKVEPTPTTSETTGNVTINNIGKPGQPARFDVSFRIELESELHITTFHLTVPVHSTDDHASYRSIESEAAQQLAPMLRDVADQIEAFVAEFNERHPPAGSPA